MGILNTLFSKREEANNLDSAAFEKLINDELNAIVLDVRTQQENSQVRIPKSVLIDIYNPNFLQKVEELNKTKTYLVYCRSGSRSYAACKQMKHLGFENIYNLKSGIISWGGRVEQG